MLFLDCHLILNKRGCYNIAYVRSYHLCINHFGITWSVDNVLLSSGLQLSCPPLLCTFIVDILIYLSQDETQNYNVDHTLRCSAFYGLYNMSVVSVMFLYLSRNDSGPHRNCTLYTRVIRVPSAFLRKL